MYKTSKPVERKYKSIGTKAHMKMSARITSYHIAMTAVADRFKSAYAKLPCEVTD